MVICIQATNYIPTGALVLTLSLYHKFCNKIITFNIPTSDSLHLVIY